MLFYYLIQDRRRDQRMTRGEKLLTNTIKLNKGDAQTKTFCIQKYDHLRYMLSVLHLLPKQHQPAKIWTLQNPKRCCGNGIHVHNCLIGFKVKKNVFFPLLCVFLSACQMLYRYSCYISRQSADLPQTRIVIK